MCAEGSSTASRLEVRACQPRDVPALLEILAQSREAANWSPAGLEAGLAQNAGHFLVAAKGAEVLGFIVGRFAADEGEILNLAVVPAHRRKGVATALVQSLLHSFAEKGVAMVFLEVRESNYGSIAFYEQMGFACVGARPGYYSDPQEAALVLQKQLGSFGRQASLKGK